MAPKPSATTEQHSSSYASELHDSSWIDLMRLVFIGSGVILSLFCLMQFLAGNYLFAACELLGSLLLLGCARYISKIDNPMWMVYPYLLVVLGFLLFIIVMPGASPTAFVWVYVVPVLCYLLLGRVRGAWLSVPFSAMVIGLYLLKYEGMLNAAGIIDLSNSILCGLLIILFMHVYEGRRAAAHNELQRIARTDALTGVASRGSFMQSLTQSIREAERSQNPLVLVILDIDHFKAVNDCWGHDAGDKALKHICAGLEQRLRTADTLGRLGGEEFGLILRNTDRARAEPLVEQLREHLCNNPLHYGKQLIELSATFGMAQWPIEGRTIDELYRRVDQRLYLGKEQGRNRVVAQDAQ